MSVTTTNDTTMNVLRVILDRLTRNLISFHTILATILSLQNWVNHRDRAHGEDSGAAAKSRMVSSFFYYEKLSKYVMDRV